MQIAIKQISHNFRKRLLMIFAHYDLIYVRLIEMSSSPFHGIFSAFAQTQAASAKAAKTSELQIVDESEEIEEHTPAQVPTQKHNGQIAVDIYEQDHYYIIRAPIAGVRLSDLDIEVDGKVLTITGARARDDAIPKDQYYVQECFWGEFSRSVTLPTVIDPKKVRATFSKDSILKVIIPKEEKIKIVRINEG